MKSTVVDESLSSFKPMYCSREYQTSTRLIQQYEKSTLNWVRMIEFESDCISLSQSFVQMAEFKMAEFKMGEFKMAAIIKLIRLN